MHCARKKQKKSINCSLVNQTGIRCGSRDYITIIMSDHLGGRCWGLSCLSSAPAATHTIPEALPSLTNAASLAARTFIAWVVALNFALRHRSHVTQARLRDYDDGGQSSVPYLRMRLTRVNRTCEN